MASENKELTRDVRQKSARYEDALVGVLALVATALLFWATFFFRAVNWTPLGLAFWPRVILVLIAIFAISLIALRQLDNAPRLRVSRHELTLCVLIAGFVVALPLFGFVLTSIGYVFVTVLWLDSDKNIGWKRAGLIALATTALIYLAFGFGLKVWLPVGLIGNW